MPDGQIICHVKVVLLVCNFLWNMQFLVIHKTCMQNLGSFNKPFVPPLSSQRNSYSIICCQIKTRPQNFWITLAPQKVHQVKYNISLLYSRGRLATSLPRPTLQRWVHAFSSSVVLSPLHLAAKRRSLVTTMMRERGRREPTPMWRTWTKTGTLLMTNSIKIHFFCLFHHLNILHKSAKTHIFHILARSGH